MIDGDAQQVSRQSTSILFKRSTHPVGVSQQCHASGKDATPCSASVVMLSVGVRGLQLVAGSQHGQAPDHAVHVEPIRGAGTRLDTGLR